jgi:hypothetical protein
MSFDGRNRFTDFADNFFRGVPAGNALVVISNLIDVGERFRRPNSRAFASGHTTWSFAG